MSYPSTAVRSSRMAPQRSSATPPAASSSQARDSGARTRWTATFMTAASPAVRTEELDFISGSLPYERSEASVEWHWNETTAKDSYLSASFGLFNTSCTLGPSIDEDFFGLALGAGGTKDLSRLFLTGSIKLKLDDESEGPYVQMRIFLASS